MLETFFYNIQQCVRYEGSVPKLLDIKIGAPQRTKMGPCLWLIYVNNLRVEGFSCVKYADDTTFYTNVLDSSFSDMISSAVEATVVGKR